MCGDTIREVSFADSSLQYCPTCQTGGKPLADRRLSRLLKLRRPCPVRAVALLGTLGGRHLGAIAQLEERLVCIQKARGSSPLSSTGQKLVVILEARRGEPTGCCSPRYGDFCAPWSRRRLHLLAPGRYGRTPAWCSPRAWARRWTPRMSGVTSAPVQEGGHRGCLGTAGAPAHVRLGHVRVGRGCGGDRLPRRARQLAPAAGRIWAACRTGGMCVCASDREGPLSPGLMARSKHSWHRPASDLS